ncbi:MULTISPECIES: flagellar basal-body MS-ring/collar protein FliF [unclassified Treponema]|uniref:flagellar basal-body MS-ring/collar protein FliF n=1 Tax=unclassified Treponema TaxID=2638727 RepID=UPI0025CF3840|nr:MULTISPECIES: flagellar basal-body MS-ring/collar protein FliF [unclassified Treponema]MBQ8679867.1 flagellar M-ring protein FliF [Treponema sp.]
MNDWLKNTTAKLKSSWASWKPVQKAIAAGIVVAVIVVLVLVFRGSSKPTTIALFNTPITDQAARDDIAFRLDQENIKYTINSTNGMIYVDDEGTARRAKAILIAEDLVPTRVDVFSQMLDVTNWSTTDFERQKNDLRRVTNQVKQHIESLDDIASADVVITPGQNSLFESQRVPASASVTLRFKNGSVIENDRKRIQGIQRLILRSVSGLTEDNIVILNTAGDTLNDFAGMAEMDRLSLIERTEKFKLKLASEKRAKVIGSLQSIYGEDRVRDLDVNVDMDTSKVSSDKTIHTPIMITEQDPSKPYDTTEKRDYLPISTQTVTKEWTGTGYNPEGPAGVEGQNPPAYSDMSNVIGKSTETGVVQNNVVNVEHRTEERMPAVDRITVSVNIDGNWEKITDGSGNPVFVTEKNLESLKERYPDWEDQIKYRFALGHILRIYSPLSADELEQTANYLQGAIGYDASRNYRVVVTNIKFNRQNEQDLEDSAIIRAQQTRKTIMLVLIGVVIILIAFIVFRMISRELERRRRLREEELLRRQQAEREKALWDAKQEGMEVTMSVEERKRAELQENAIAMAKEHPEDVAMLIRTWMMEE